MSDTYVITEKGIQYLTQVLLDFARRDPEAAEELARVCSWDLRAWLLEQENIIPFSNGPYR